MTSKIVVNNIESDSGINTVTIIGDVSVGSSITATDITATHHGSGADLTNLPAANLTGTLPAIDGSALTGIDVSPAGVSDQNNTSTGYFDLPVGTTAQRPGSPADGMIRFNSTESQTEEYRDSGWFSLSNKSAVTGGTQSTSGGYTIHTFTSSGTLTVSGQAKSGVDYLLVAGGGGGGNSRAGGGGGGGMTVTTGATLAPGTYTITVGAGGAGGADGGGAGNTGIPGTTGNNSSFGSISSVLGGGGGGGGGSISDRVGKNGGSGGGGSDGQGPGSGTTGQGNNGGNSSSSAGGGGGGGAGGEGGSTAGQQGIGGNGGAASANSYSGSSVNYSGGGGGGSRDNNTPGTGGSGAGSGGKTTGANSTAGTANRGGGGGGGGRHNGYSAEHFYGSNGGSGIVIIRYLT